MVNIYLYDLYQVYTFVKPNKEHERSPGHIISKRSKAFNPSYPLFFSPPWTFLERNFKVTGIIFPDTREIDDGFSSKQGILEFDMRWIFWRLKASYEYSIQKNTGFRRTEGYFAGTNIRNRAYLWQCGEENINLKDSEEKGMQHEGTLHSRIGTKSKVGSISCTNNFKIQKCEFLFLIFGS